MYFSRFQTRILFCKLSNAVPYLFYAKYICTGEHLWNSTFWRMTLKTEGTDLCHLR